MKIISKGTPIGLQGNGPFYWSGNVVACGGVATGKTRCITMNRLLSAGQAGESVVCFDPSGDLTALTAHYFRGKGYEIRSEDPSTWEKDGRWAFHEPYEPATEKWACFISTKDEGTMSGILNEALDHISGYLRANGLKTCPVPVHFVFDEFTCCEKIGEIEDRLSGAANQIPGAVDWNRLGIDFTLIFQSIEALIHLYGPKRSEKIMSRANALIFMGGTHISPNDRYIQCLCHHTYDPARLKSDEELVLLPNSQAHVFTKYDYLENPESKKL